LGFAGIAAKAIPAPKNQDAKNVRSERSFIERFLVLDNADGREQPNLLPHFS
jgi:hypothetical protein